MIVRIKHPWLLFICKHTQTHILDLHCSTDPPSGRTEWGEEGDAGGAGQAEAVEQGEGLLALRPPPPPPPPCEPSTTPSPSLLPEGIFSSCSTILRKSFPSRPSDPEPVSGRSKHQEACFRSWGEISSTRGGRSMWCDLQVGGLLRTDQSNPKRSR